MRSRRKYSSIELRKIRNDIPLKELCHALGVQCKLVEDFWRFLCPMCRDFHTAINPRNNLGRCFRCQKNINSIDMVMITTGRTFTEAVSYLLQERNVLAQQARLKTKNDR